MAATQITSKDVGSIQRNDFDITTAGEAVITKVIAGTNITISSTGADAGTGDVTINLSGGSGISRSINVISTTQTLGAVASTDYVYMASGTITLTMPTAVGNSNSYSIKNIGTGVITIVFTSGQTADGNTTITMTYATSPNQSRDFISDGSNWRLI